MRIHSLKYKYSFILFLVLITCFLLVPVEVNAFSISELARVSVKIECVQVDNLGDEIILGSGSGTIISEDGLILTNAHVAYPQAPGLMLEDPTLINVPNPDKLIIALNKNEREAPVRTYYAEVLAYDGVLDVALLKITHNIDGSKVDKSLLKLPYVDLGDSSLLSLGEEIFIFGYPGIGGETITFTSGRISGFTSTEKLGNASWIKTEALVSPGNSGGMAANNQGSLVGIPTQIVGDELTTISRLRPVDLAKKVINTYLERKSYKTPYLVYGSGNEKLYFNSWYDTQERPVAGYNHTYLLYGSFTGEGLTIGQDLFTVWKKDGEIISYGNSTWDGEDIWIGLENGGEEIPIGSYEVIILALNAHSAGWQSIGRKVIDVGVDAYSHSDQEVTTPGKPPKGKPEPDKGDRKMVMTGRIMDVYSGKGIAAATVIFLNNRIGISEFQEGNFTADDILIKVQTSKGGSFKTPAVFESSNKHIMVILAEGYEETAYHVQIEEDNGMDFPITRSY